MILLDTHALLWAVTRHKSLGRKARQRITREWDAGRVAISAITFWEVAQLQLKRRIKLAVPAEEWRALRLAEGLIELPVTGAIGVQAVGLAGLPDDPADRMIVATAVVHHAELVTADARLLAWPHPLVRHDAAA